MFVLDNNSAHSLWQVAKTTNAAIHTRVLKYNVACETIIQFAHFTHYFETNLSVHSPKNELILLLYVPKQTGGGVEAVVCLLPIFSAEKKTVEPEGQNLSEGRSAVQGL